MKSIMPGAMLINGNDRPVIAIGDVHGCAKEFEELCALITLKYTNPLIVQVGDLIDRGPYFKEVFDVVKKYDVVTLTGNHELNFLLEYRGLKRCNSLARRESHDRMARLSTEDQESILEILDKSLNAVEINYDGEKILLSHSPIKGVESLNFTYNAWDCCTRNEPYDRTTLGAYEWKAVHGHQHWNYTPIEDQIATNVAFNVDGGVVYGGELVGLEVFTEKSITVKAKKVYFNK
jgi:hypothetical protein